MKLNYKVQFGPKMKPISEAASTPVKTGLMPTQERQDLRQSNLRRDKVRALAHIMDTKKTNIK